MSTASAPLSIPQAWNAGALSIYQRLLPASFWKHLCRSNALRQNNRVYTFGVVIWLMISQWLHGHATLDSAVSELTRGLPLTFWPRPCKRLRDWLDSKKPLSGHTAAYNIARHQLPYLVVKACCASIFEQLTSEIRSYWEPLGMPAYLVDGTSVELPSTEELRCLYPPACNQHGEAHWPLLRMLVAHDLQTGLALCPHWGAMYGKEAVSEQQLFETAIDQFPAKSLIVGDCNFGVSSIAHAADQRGHMIVLRLTGPRATHLLGGPLRDGIDQRITWTPSAFERRAHPELPKDASVCGRVVVSMVQPSDGAQPFLLALFTTWNGTREQFLGIYGRRWQIETDLRTLKGTLQLEQLRCITPEMIGKELLLAMAAYNLVRAVIYHAAQTSGLPPRSFSFSRVYHLVQVYAPAIAAARTPEERHKLSERLMHYARQATLPKRTRKRPTYPREVWPKPQAFPPRRA